MGPYQPIDRRPGGPCGGTETVRANGACLGGIRPVLLSAFVLLLSVAGPVSAVEDAAPRHVGVVVYEGYVATEAVAAFVVFARAAREPELAGLRVLALAETAEPVRSAEGLRILPDATFAEAPPLDVLVVPAGEAIEERLRDDALRAFLAARAPKARATLGVCSGVHLLAGAGLLDGRRATTFPGGEGALQRAHPDATIVEGAAIVRDGNLVTVSGELLTWQAALDIVAEWAGEAVARRVAEGLFLDRLVDEVGGRVAPEGDR